MGYGRFGERLRICLLECSRRSIGLWLTVSDFFSLSLESFNSAPEQLTLFLEVMSVFFEFGLKFFILFLKMFGIKFLFLQLLLNDEILIKHLV